MLTIALASPSKVAPDPLRGGAESADPEAEAMWMKYPGESFYTLPKVRSPAHCEGARGGGERGGKGGARNDPFVRFHTWI